MARDGIRMIAVELGVTVDEDLHDGERVRERLDWIGGKESFYLYML